ncbi:MULTISPECIES: HNH endonuclease signature motif containing protein [unclassified Pseudonocardia]|uniref:HNH endonuclease n=1 Tax=unclassified Pseudonocardia TaxID=2619320 RepID=UPI0001FFE6E4|nr:HNH endonuclease signature motif containing protein [Pseudonocardia sp. Ae707_Ps1]
MTAVQEPPRTGLPAGDPGFPQVDLALVQLAVEQAAHDDLSGVSEAELIDQIQQLESVQHSLAALQATRVRAFARLHVENGITAGQTDPDRLQRGVVAQVGLACRVSPTEARRRVSTARDLHDGLDHVRGLFAAGELSALKAAAVVTACSDLDRAERAAVDLRLAGHDLTRLGIRRLQDLARKFAAEVAPEKFRARVESARAERRVTLRPAPDAMTYLTAYLPVEQGVACLAALNKALTEVSVNPAPLTRTRGQVMADTLVERLTGQAIATDVDVEVQVVVPIEALLDPDSPLPAEVPGHGPVPVDLLATGEGRKTLRRLITSDGVVIGGDSRQRTFTGLLARLVRARAGNRCTEPYCDAPVRHIDHIHRDAEGGATELDNGRGVCEFHNHVREQAGWRVARGPDGGVRTTTPTGHTYLAPG